MAVFGGWKILLGAIHSAKMPLYFLDKIMTLTQINIMITSIQDN